MTRARPSLARRLQASFALVALIVIGTFAVLMDVMLEHTLEREDAVVMEAQASSLIQALSKGGSPRIDELPRPEKSEWQWIQEGRILHESSGMAALPAMDWTSLPSRGEPVEVERGAHRMSLLRRSAPSGELRMVMDRSHEAVLLSRFRKALGLGAMAAALIAAWLGWVVARRGLRPLERIAAGTAAVRPGGTFDPLDAEAFPQELAELVSVLNASFLRLQEAIHRLDQLASELAHELRTPLQRLRSSLESLALQRQMVSPESLGSVLEACEGLQRLIDSMLLLAKTEDPSATLSMQTFDVAQLLEETRDFFEGLAEEEDITLAVACPPGLVLSAQASLVRRALHNLMANALKATPSKGRIQLSAQAEEGSIVLSVEDTGQGFSEDVLKRFGTRWIRGEGSDGHGLGLAIVKGILAMHGGTVRLAARIGGGAAVALIFPVQKTDGGPAL
jgi:two-component system heavy metal sensor histidine kinase CusS